MIKITIKEELILKHANPSDPIFIAGTFNDWNCQVDQFEYDVVSKCYTKVLNIPAETDVLFKSVNTESNSWFSLPDDVLTIDQSNSDGNNIIKASKLPYENDFIKVESLNKEAEKNFIVLQEEKVEIDNAHHPTGFTNLMRSENFSNILISTDDNDMNSISSSLKSSKLNFDGKTPPSASLTASTTKGTKKEYSKSSLLKRLFGYK